MAMVMDMSSYLVEHEEAAEYSEEILSTGWIPALDLACQQASPAASNRPAELPASLAAVDAETFLLNMYSCQR